MDKEAPITDNTPQGVNPEYYKIVLENLDKC